MERPSSGDRRFVSPVGLFPPLRFDRGFLSVQSITKCRTFVRRTRNQFVLHDAKFLHEHLRRTSTFFPLAEKTFPFVQKKPLPSWKWVKNSNSTHGFIRATIDFSVGPKPINVIGYRARTLNDKRLVDSPGRENVSRPFSAIHLDVISVC